MNHPARASGTSREAAWAGASAGSRLLARCAWLGLAVLLGCWLVGAVAFLRADGIMTWTLPEKRGAFQGEHRAEHNLIAPELGPTVRASSYHRDVLTQHHPAFLIDGRRHPGGLEKWASDPRDTRPFVELTWRRPRQLSRVEIWHAGLVESDELSVRNYRLRCLTDAQPAPTLLVRDNRSDHAVHAFACRDARGLRIDWQPNQKDPVVRIYEVEAWGR